MRHDVDSLEALQANLAWSRAKRRARQWAIVVPFLALPILNALLRALPSDTGKGRVSSGRRTLDATGEG